jgi:hypothetical protein
MRDLIEQNIEIKETQNGNSGTIGIWDLPEFAEPKKCDDF